jgi:hypothetical protein
VFNPKKKESSMIGKMLKGTVAAIAAFAVCTSILAADLVDNPRYLAWAKYKAGTNVKMDMDTAAGGQNMKSAMTTTLKEVTPEKVVLEMKTSMTVPGMAAPMDNVMTMTEPAKIEPGKIKPTNPEQMPNCKVVGKGTEDVKIGGKSYNCDWYEVEMEQQGMKITSKLWTSNDLPDKMVKNETKMAMGNTSMILTEFNIVK